MSLPPVTFSGMLKKTGGWLTESKQDRYFEIRGPVLYYHETKPQSADAKPKGEIALTHTSLSNNPIDPLEFFIAGDHLKKTFKLTAASEDEVAMWMWKLRLANPNVADSFHSDARMLAHVTRQQLNGVRKDIGKNANVNTTVDKVISQFLGKTVPQPDKLISQLQAAGAENDVAEALEAMAGLNDTALHIAAMGGCAPVAEVLLQSGASAAATNNEGLTPLHYAAEFDKVDVAKLLIGQNAPLDVKDCKGFSPLNTAAHQGSMEVLNLLLAHKAPLDSPNRRWRHTPHVGRTKREARCCQRAAGSGGQA